MIISISDNFTLGFLCCNNLFSSVKWLVVRCQCTIDWFILTGCQECKLKCKQFGGYIEITMNLISAQKKISFQEEQKCNHVYLCYPFILRKRQLASFHSEKIPWIYLQNRHINSNLPILHQWDDVIALIQWCLSEAKALPSFLSKENKNMINLLSIVDISTNIFDIAHLNPDLQQVNSSQANIGANSMKKFGFGQLENQFFEYKGISLTLLPLNHLC